MPQVLKCMWHVRRDWHCEDTMVFYAGQPLTAADLNYPIATLRQTTLQTLTTGTWTALTFTTEDVDSHNGHSNSSNTDQYVIQKSGNYWISGKSAYAANATGQRGSRFTKNGTAIASSQVLAERTGANNTMVAAPTNLDIDSIDVDTNRIGVEKSLFDESSGVVGADQRQADHEHPKDLARRELVCVKWHQHDHDDE